MPHQNSNKTLIRRRVQGLLAGLLAAVSVSASALTIEFTGHTIDPFGTYATGTQFSGSVSYDPAQVSDPTIMPGGIWDYEGAYRYQGFSLQLGSERVADLGRGAILVEDHSAPGTYPITWYDTDGSGGPTDIVLFLTTQGQGSLGGVTLRPWTGVIVDFVAANNSVLSDPSLPQNPQITDWTFGSILLLGEDLGGNVWRAEGWIDSAKISNNAVPAPSVLSLLTIGLLGLTTTRRRV